MVPRELVEADETIAVERDVGAAIKAFSAGTADAVQQRKVYAYILHALAAVDRASFVRGDDSALLLAHREGRRFVGRHLRRIVETPMADAPDDEPAPPHRQTTMTARVEGVAPKPKRRRKS